MNTRIRTLLLLLAASCFSGLIRAQGYINVHNKSINEESSVDLSYTLKDNSGVTISTFNLNDLSSNYLNPYDVGAGHGNGAGELWTIAGNSVNSLSAVGTVYRRANGNSQWIATTVTGISNAGRSHGIDGAYLNQFVYLTAGKVNFYNAGVISTIYTLTDATDVSCANGNIAITTTTFQIKTWAGNFTSSTVSASTIWNTIVNGSTEIANRLDLSADGLTVAFINNTAGATVKTIPFAGGTATDLALSNAVARPGSTISPFNFDIAYDDNGAIYATGNSNSGGSVIYSYTGGAWTTEPEARNVKVLTGGPGGQAWGISSQGVAQSFYTRATDNLGNHYWIDEERVKNPATPQSGNSLFIQVPAGIYTVTETFPAGWDLGRFNIYDPTGNSTGSTVTNAATLNVSNNESVNVEFVSEKLNPTSIPLNCTPQVLQSFDQGATFGSGAYGLPLQNTAYHYASATNPPDGYYFLVNAVNGKFYSSNVLTDHTGNGGYFLVVNAAYSKDEFYRQRVTNLVPGLQYIISFYAGSLSSGINPNVSFGLQDLSGNTFGSSSTGNIPLNVWTKYSITFTMPTGVTTADLFLKNNNIGGSGNDIGIDDITLNPVNPPPAAVGGFASPNLCLGTTYNFTDATPGGVWQSSNTAAATINASSGVLTTVANGSTVISYTTSNAVGCTSSATSLKTVNPVPTVSSTAVPATVCTGQQITLSSTPGAGTSPYTYAWTGSPSASAGITGPTLQNASAKPTASGTETYSITLTDSKGCTASSSNPVTVSTNAAPTVTTTSTGSVCAGGIVTLTSTPAGGTVPYNYLWSGSGIGTTNTKNTTSVPTITGTYTVQVTDNKGCIGTANTAIVTVNPLPSVTVTNSNPNLCGNQNLILSSIPSGGSGIYSTFSWTSSIGGTINGSTTAQNTTAKPITSGTYSYTMVVKDSKGCSGTASTTVPVSIQAGGAFTVTASYNPATTPICTGNSVALTSSVSSGGTAPFSYAWTGSGVSVPSSQNTTALPVSSGLFTMTVTDANNCYTTANTANLVVNPSPTVNSSSTSVPVICTTSPGVGTVTLNSAASGGTGALSYAWTQMTNSGGGSGGLVSAIGQNTTATPTDFGTYTYTITATDTKACTATAIVSVSELNQTAPSIGGITPSTGSAVCGSIINLTAVASSGTPPYLYTWTGTGVTTAANSTTASGTANPAIGTTNTYTLKVSDANSCQSSAATIVTLNPNIVVTASPFNASTCAGTTLTLSASTSGGSGTYSTYAWTQSSSSAGLVVLNSQSTTATPTAAGSYTYTVGVTDNKGCTASGNAGTTTIGPAFTSTAALNTNNLCSAASQIVSLSSLITGGGTAPYTYSWSSANGATFTTPSQATSSATLTGSTDAFSLLTGDSKGCFSSAYAGAVTVNPSPTVNASMDKTLACASPATTVNLSAVPGGGSGGASTYLWTASASSGSGLITSGAGQNNNTQNTSVIPSAGGNGTYTIQLNDADGCSASATTPTSITVDVLMPVIKLNCSPTLVSLDEISGTPGVSWLWSTTSTGTFTPSNTTKNPIITKAGVYTVVITDGNSCNGSASSLFDGNDCSALPITLTRFDAIKNGDKTLLSWSTAIELNNDHFDLERKTEGEAWIKIGEVKGRGNSTTVQNYEFIDRYPLLGLNYYRLKQVDIDQHFTYSGIRFVEFSGEWIVSMYPNPTNSYDPVHISSNIQLTGIQVLSINGHKIKERQISLGDGQGNNPILLDMRIYASGIYVIRVVNSKGEIKNIQLVKE